MSPISAAVMWPNGKAYFFSGDRYIRYDVAVDRAIRRGKQCAEPGIRDTSNPWAAPTPELEERRYAGIWDDPTTLPWASETSPHAKVAIDGSIVRGGSL